MSHDKIESEIDRIMGRMSLDDKIGQCLTLNCLGWQITDVQRRFVQEFRCGGLRVTPHISATNDTYHIRKMAPHVAPAATAATLRELHEMALERNGIPLHMATDQEGDLSVDLVRGGIQLFPSNMGMAATDDPDLARQAFRVVARQVRAHGINMLHSPELDVNLNPNNPEIGMRAFSDDPEVCAQYGLLAMNAFMEEGVIPTAKHFPGRGDSEVDAHDQLDVLRVDRQRLEEVELHPYRALIREGLPVVMTAHNAYTALDDERVPASVSYKITTGLLREEMGFDGVVTTDAIGMAGLIQYAGGQWGATVMAIQAGADLVLIREDEATTRKCWEALRAAVKSREITEDRIDQSVRRILRMKMRAGLFESALPDPAAVQASIACPENKAVCRKVFEKGALIVRDRERLIPLPRQSRALVVEPYLPLYHDKGNDADYHAGMFFESMARHSPSLQLLETRCPATEADWARFRERVSSCDTVVFFNVFWRGSGSLRPLIREAVTRGKKVIVATNDLYDAYYLPDVGAVLCTFGAVPQATRVAADIVFGVCRPEGKWPLRRLEQSCTVDPSVVTDHAVSHYSKKIERVGL